MTSPNVVVSAPSQLFTLPNSFAAIAGGSIYIGQINTDPTVAANQIQVYVQNDDGSTTAVSQPISIGGGGYPEYNGVVAKFVTVEGQSMAVLDANGVQQFYYPDVLKYDPDQLRVTLASAAGATYVGYENQYIGGLATTLASQMNNSIHNLVEFGAVSGTDCTVAFKAAIASGCQILYIPRGTWGYSARLDFGGMRVMGAGPYANTGSRLLCLDAAGIIACGTGAHWSCCLIDGNGSGSTNGIGEYGFILGGSYSQFMHCEVMSVRNFKKYGFILDAAQNSSLLKIDTQNNAVNFLFVNGVRNILAMQCHGALDIDPTTGRIPTHRNMLWTNIAGDPNFNGTTLAAGNSRIQILQGIFEYGNYADCNIEIAHAGQNDASSNKFEHVEISNAVVDMVRVTDGKCFFDDCSFIGTDTQPSIHIGPTGISRVNKDGSFGAQGGGKFTPYLGVTTDAGGIFICPGGLPLRQDFNQRGSGAGWQSFQSATAVWDPVSHRTAVTHTAANTGTYLRVYSANTPAVITQGQLFRLKGFIEIASGAAPRIEWGATGNTFHQIAGASSVASGFEFYYRTVGDELPLIYVLANDANGEFFVSAFEVYLM
ncbi:phage tailspike protein [Sodalis ligni]|uniref:Head binding protein n=1 Tax=Sodalis ligni TaxID=2697027 RepID=A0A4R1NHE1_9GAMM|nr:phage tailspike protein [Sodalis ligni]TCL07154.1 head binding protein [Sodalis ligni]